MRLGVFADSVDSVADVRASRRQPSLQLVGRPTGGRSMSPGSAGRECVSWDACWGRTGTPRGVRQRHHRDHGRRGPEAGTAADSHRPVHPRSGTRGRAARARAVRADLARGLRRARDVHRPAGRRHPDRGLGHRLPAALSVAEIPVLDGEGEIRHEGGVTPVPGLYVLGLHFQRRRNSGFIDGVGADAEFLANHIASGVRSRSIDELSPSKGSAAMDPKGQSTFARTSGAHRLGSDLDFFENSRSDPSQTL
jgi:putative flavoprotein involved in K+ transport